MSRSSLPEALGRLLERAGTLIAPTRLSPGDAVFAPVSSPNEIALDYGNTLISPVSALFPPQDELFRVETDAAGRPRIIAEAEQTRQVIFGLRPCDVAAIARTDRFFLEGEFCDDLYAARRRGTRLVALACETPAHEHCFCSCCESGPVAEGGYDVQLSGVDDAYLVEAGTEAGAAMLQAWSGLLTPTTAGDVERRDAQAARLHTELLERGNMPAAIRRVTGDAVAEELWETIGARCFACSGCSMVCPRCTCFHVLDETLDDGTVVRLRRWDSCRLEGYTREASGFNPREAPAARAHRFSYHKLSYRYVERDGDHGCVGCGRCAIVCMGGVDMPTVAQMIRRGLENG